MNIKLILIISFSILYGFFEIFMSMRQKNQREISKSLASKKPLISLKVSLGKKLYLPKI